MQDQETPNWNGFIAFWLTIAVIVLIVVVRAVSG